MGDASPTPRIRRRRLIERPRLFRALDRSKARVRTLVGGPGFGKTVLLEQWAPRDDRVAVWFRARRSAADVAVVARGLVAATEQVVPGAGRRLLERLAVTDDPEREAVLLGEMLAEDLVEWPEGAWIVIDDYHNLAVSPGCEAFVETIVNRTPVRLVLASRIRPSWVTGRDLLYGDVLEIPQGALAMNAEEAEEVLEGGRSELTSGLLALAEGWPAVIGLAGMAPGVTEIDADLPETLYEFFAGELYRALDPTIRTGLAVLAAMPSVDAELAGILLGAERSERVCDESLALGILDERDGRLELHPLAAAFFERRGRPDAIPDRASLYERALQVYRNRRDWDAAFELTDKFGRGEELEAHLVDCLDELLHGGRLATLENWIGRASGRVGQTATVAIARAELTLRQGQHLTAQSLAEQALDAERQTDWTRFRALTLAGHAAHIGSRETAALAFFEQAGLVSTNEADRRRALWGRLVAATALEHREAPDLFRSLERSAGPRLDPSEAVRAADKRLALGLRFGAVKSLPEARSVAELLPSVGDPFVRASFRSTYSCALNLAAEYEAALEISQAMIEDAAEFRVDFALPYAYLMVGAATAGLRRFDDAHLALARAMDEALRCNDEFAQQGVYAGRIRALLHQGRVPEACGLEPPNLVGALPGMRGEVLHSRALALACIGRLDEAANIVASSRDSTQAVEAGALARCVDAVCAVRRRAPSLGGDLDELIDFAFSAGAVDFVVTSYRANPDLLGALLRHHPTAERTGYVLARANDTALASSVGVDLASTVDPLSKLSPREREVYDLLCDGLSNHEIGRKLFISEATAKQHVRHVYDKLQIRSRTALMMSAVQRRGQAAPISSTEPSAPSSE